MKFLFYTLSLILIFSSCDDIIDVELHNKSFKNKHSLPILSIVAKNEDLFSYEKGIYVKGVGLGEDWAGNKANYLAGNKIKAHFAYFEKDKIQIQQFIDIKVSGVGSRALPQKSFNLYANKKYEKKVFKYPFFKQLEIEEFTALRIRNSGQDWSSTLFRDVLMHSIVEDLDIDIQASQPVVMYLNGKYWGIYNLREKFNKKYLKEHFTLKTDKIDAIEQRLQVIYGDSIAYAKLMKFIKNNDLSIDSNYQKVSKKIDLDNFIDYYTAEIYFANTDWPSNNIKFWRPKTKKGKWRWFLHDTDMGFGFAPFAEYLGGVNHNTFHHVLNDSITPYHNTPWSTFLFRNLLKNKNFQKRFLSTFKYNLETAFNSNRVKKLIKEHQSAIENEMKNHIQRWKDIDDDRTIQSLEEWHNNIDTLIAFGLLRPEIVKKQLIEYFNLTEKDWGNLKKHHI